MIEVYYKEGNDFNYPTYKVEYTNKSGYYGYTTIYINDLFSSDNEYEETLFSRYNSRDIPSNSSPIIFVDGKLIENEKGKQNLINFDYIKQFEVENIEEVIPMIQMIELIK